VTPVLLICLALLPTSALLLALYARAMRARSLGQSIRAVGPAGHASKSGTPTMGGALLCLLWLGAVGLLLIWRPMTPAMGLVLAGGGLFALIGAADDLISLRRSRSLGLTPWQKIALSTVAVVCLFFLFRDALAVPMQVPFSVRSVSLPPAALFALTWFVFLGATNGVNLTDGLDGLAGGVVLLILVGVLLLRPTPENLMLCAPLLAPLAGFLWLNTHPAEIILGDVGSYFLGGTLAALAMVNGLAFLLPVLAGVLVLEVGSAALQMSCFRLTGRRLFRMTPLHHHFEIDLGVSWTPVLPGPRWPEQRIVVRFWIVQGAFLVLGLLAGGVGR